MSDEKNVLLISHGITGVTGFANQLWLQARALIEDKKHKYNVYVIHRDYRGEPFSIPKDSGIKLNSGRSIEGLNILPVGNQQWCEDVGPYYLEKYKIDYLHTLGDIWCYQYYPQVPKKRPWKWLGHYVFDTENMVSFWNNSIKNADISVVPSKNSYELVKRYGHKNIQYVPHGIDTNTYKPCTYEEKLEFRESIGLPKDGYIIGMVAHNQHRKKIYRLLVAFQKFLVKNPNAFLVMHTAPKDSTGWDLPLIISDMGIKNHVLFTDKASKGFGDLHVPESELRKLYCSMDIHALSTGGEGFGVPIVEAMACGIPNVAPAYTTPKEFLCDVDPLDATKLVNERGIAVPYVDVDMHHTGGLWCIVDTNAMANAFQYLKDNQGEASKMGMKARKFAVENYDNEIVKTQWQELYANFDALSEAGEDKDELFKLRTLRM